jgi:hypothetical protein
MGQVIGGRTSDAVPTELVPVELWMHPSMTAALTARDWGGVLRLVRRHAGWSQKTMVTRTGVPQAQISPIMAGKVQVKTLDRMEQFADGLGMPDHARITAGLAPRGTVMDHGVGCSCRDPGAEGRSCAMHRRQFLTTAAATTAGLAPVPASMGDPGQVADLVRARAGSNVDEATLDDLDLTVEHLLDQVAHRPHHELFGLAARNWAAAEGLLDGWQSLTHRRRLLELTGQLSFYVGRLHYSAGRYPQAWQLAALSGRYATETGDQVLRHSAVVLQSSAAFYGGNHRRAVQVLQRGNQHATNYTRARALACAARAHSALGDRDATLAALTEMRAAVVNRPAQPGEFPFTEACGLLMTTRCRRPAACNAWGTGQKP